MVRFYGPAIEARHAQRFQRDALGIEHPRDVMIGDDEQIGGRAEGRFGVAEQPRVHVAVRADQRQVADQGVQITRKHPDRGVGIERAVGIEVERHGVPSF